MGEGGEGAKGQPERSGDRLEGNEETKGLRDQKTKRQPERSGDRLERNDSRAAGSPRGEINIRD